MKRIVLYFGFLILFSFAIAFNTNLNKNGENLNINIENVEALARGEWEIQLVFCAVTEPTVCVVFEDGYFVIGYRLYGK